MPDTIIVKNNTGTSVFIEDMGAAVPGSGERIFSDIFDFTEICVSEDLKIFINNSTFTINNGTSDLNIADAIEYLDCKNISSGGGALYLNDLLDVNIGTPNDKFTLVYDASSGKWVDDEGGVVEYNPEIPPDSTSVIWIDRGAIYNYNEIVGDWVSSSSNIFSYGRSGNISGAYLGIGGWSSDGYYYIPYKGYITSLHCHAMGGQQNKEFEIHINKVNAFSFVMDVYDFNVKGLALLVTRGDILQLWCTSIGGPIKDVVCQVVIVWSNSEI